MLRPKCPKIMETIQLVKTFPRLDERVKTLKSYLRSLQLKNLFESSKSKALRLEELLYYDRSSFWKKVKSFKKNSKKRAKILKNEVTHEEYVEYFSNLFSHSDRPSNPNKILIEKKVLEYFESIKGKSLKIEFNRLHIQDSLRNLKINKAAGFDGLSNEFFKFVKF